MPTNHHQRRIIANAACTAAVALIDETAALYGVTNELEKMVVASVCSDAQTLYGKLIQIRKAIEVELNAAEKK